VTVHYSDTFKRQLKRLSRKYRRIRSDVQPLIEQLEAGETPGEQIQSTGYTVYKARLSNTDARRGKSGGYRAIYYLQQQNDILLVTLYSKTDQSDIDAREVIQIIQEEE
jgi:mRNA-degrading endonuclease RelE of RelBE toxin-antitoxin system